MKTVPFTWAYGVTTVPGRRKTLLPRTLASLRSAGFTEPWLFIDGDHDGLSWQREFNLRVTCRNPPIRPFGNWALALAELFIRSPYARRYAIFQDDILAYPNLRQYLELTPMAANTYWNLYTFPRNYELAPAIGATGRRYIGFYPSNQLGWGGLGLVFNNETVLKLLTHPHFTHRPLDLKRGHQALDGGVLDSLKKQGYTELVHNPSLLQHTGGCLSTLKKRRHHPNANSWRGEAFNALELLEEAKHN